MARRIVLTSQGNLRRACAAVVSSAACGCRRARPGRVPLSESVPVPGPLTPVQRTARSLLALASWSVDLPWPPGPRGIIVVYPHTSNWDFVVGILALLATGLAGGGCAGAEGGRDEPPDHATPGTVAAAWPRWEEWRKTATRATARGEISS